MPLLRGIDNPRGMARMALRCAARQRSTGKAVPILYASGVGGPTCWVARGRPPLASAGAWRHAPDAEGCGRCCAGAGGAGGARTAGAGASLVLGDARGAAVGDHVRAAAESAVGLDGGGADGGYGRSGAGEPARARRGALEPEAGAAVSPGAAPVEGAAVDRAGAREIGLALQPRRNPHGYGRAVVDRAALQSETAPTGFPWRRRETQACRPGQPRKVCMALLREAVPVRNTFARSPGGFS